jgi:tripartite motif-containing protein 2/3
MPARSQSNNCIILGITNYPIGVGINGAGEITIADNHNNFNLSVFSQDGQLISALESKVKKTSPYQLAVRMRNLLI